MILDWRKYWWQPGFLAAFFAVGIPYWLIPYNKLNLPDAVLGFGLLVLVVVAALARISSGRRLFVVVAVMGASVPAAVMVRVIFDGFRDSSSHNLWPFELVIAVFVGGAAAFVGALIGSLALRVLRGGGSDT
jgi:hypothetical protein